MAEWLSSSTQTAGGGPSVVITLRKSGGEYELLVTGRQTAEPGHYRHESLEGALDQVAELVKLAEELEG